MAVIVKYVVERNGEEKMTFTSKAEADAYDKMLDMADELFSLLGKSELLEDEGKQEDLAMFLAQNKEEVLYALGAKRKPAPKKQRSLKLLKKIANKKTLHKPLICFEKTSHYAAFFYAIHLSPYISSNIKNRFNIPNCSKFHVAD